MQSDKRAKSWRAWTSGELRRLEDLRTEGKTVPACAIALGRSLASVKCRVASEGFVSSAAERLAKNAAWTAALTRPHVIAEVAAEFGVSYHAAKRRKYRLRLAGVNVLRLRKGPRAAAIEAPAFVSPRLSAAQRALAASHVWLAEALARAFARKCPHERDTAISGAMDGLCQAAGAFAPGRGVPFAAYARARIAGAILDAVRMEKPKGFRRSADAPTVGSLNTDLGSGDTPADLLAADELPVGWELESIEETETLAARLPGRSGEAARLFFTRCDTATCRRAGRLMNLTESRVSQLLHEAVAFQPGG